MVKRIENLFILIVLMVLLLPLINSFVPILKEKELKGYFEIQSKPTLTDSDYFSGNYQELYMKYLNDNLPNRSNFIRLYNQLQFSLFTQTNANDVIIGKDNYLYELPYLKEISGDNFIGIDANRQKVESLRKINDYLEKNGKKLLVVLAAGKASFSMDKIPAEYQKDDTTNYEYLVKYLTDYKLNYIDFRKWVISQKDTTTHTLMGVTGIHWTNYTGHYVADSINRFMEHSFSRKMSTKKYITLEQTTTPRGEDNDVEKSMNLIFPIGKYNYQYPVVEYMKEENAFYPNVSVVADSYWWTINNLYSPHNQYNNYYFMYYFKNVYDKEKELTSNLNDEEFKNYIDNSDFVILMATEANFNWFPYGFIEKFNNVYNIK